MSARAPPVPTGRSMPESPFIRMGVATMPRPTKTRPSGTGGSVHEDGRQGQAHGLEEDQDEDGQADRCETGCLFHRDSGGSSIDGLRAARDINRWRPLLQPPVFACIWRHSGAPRSPASMSSDFSQFIFSFRSIPPSRLYPSWSWPPSSGSALELQGEPRGSRNGVTVTKSLVYRECNVCGHEADFSDFTSRPRRSLDPQVGF
jgi:hypothetical protein